MKDFDSRKEGEKTEYDYNSVWKEQEEEDVKKKVKELPLGPPRKGIKGKYIKKKGHVGRLQLKKSYEGYFKSNEGKDIVND